MHEMGIAMEIYRMSRQAMESHGGRVLETVRVRVGELSAVEPELLKFAWEAATAGGPDEKAELVVSFCPARQLCPSCGERAERVSRSWLEGCPRCLVALRVEGGDELDLDQVTFTKDGEGESDA